MPPPLLRSPDVEQEAIPKPMRAKTTAAKTDLVNMIVIPLSEMGTHARTWNEQIRPSFYSIAFLVTLATESLQDLFLFCS